MVIKKDPPGGDDKPAGSDTVNPADAADQPKAAENAAQAVNNEAADAEATATASEAAPAEVAADRSVADRAHAVIRSHVLMSAAAGVIPLNFVDTAALAVVQLRLLKELSAVHGVDFRADIGRSAVGTLLATVAPTALAGGVLGSMAVRMALRSVPVVGAVTRLATQPAFNAAFTYALGKVFDQHFASGGTFLTFDPEKVKAYFRAKFEEARRKKATLLGTGSEEAPAAA